MRFFSSRVLRAFCVSMSIVGISFTAGAADRGVYIDVSFGTSIAESSDTLNSLTGEGKDVDFAEGYNFSAALGYAPQTQRGFLYHTRFEIEAGLRSNSLNKVAGQRVYEGSMYAASLMANAYYDFRNGSKVTPYIGGGLGVANLRLSDSSELGLAGNESDIIPAYQMMVGITFEPEDGASSAVHLGYRYFGTLEDVNLRIDSTQSLTTDYRSHIIEGGLRLDF